MPCRCIVVRGPAAVGKTEVLRKLARLLGQDERQVISLDAEPPTYTGLRNRPEETLLIELADGGDWLGIPRQGPTREPGPWVSILDGEGRTPVRSCRLSASWNWIWANAQSRCRPADNLANRLFTYYLYLTPQFRDFATKPGIDEKVIEIEKFADRKDAQTDMEKVAQEVLRLAGKNGEGH